MVFSSLTFLCIFLPVVFVVYQVLPGLRSKNALLIIASLVFYAYGEPVLVLLMIASTIANWAFGFLVSTRGTSKKIWLALAVIVNIGFLVIFKYSNLLVESLNAVAGLNIASPQITLPIGISFYTFQALSYVIDVYRGEVTLQRNYFKVLLYIAFFPQLIAGPIVKYHDIELQLTNRRCTLDGITRGILRFSVGLGKKILIANTMATIVDTIYASNAFDINTIAAWIAALTYIMQIYFDFSGYSDMAIGMAQMFGFKFKENFNYPYTSCSIKEFWRRWHISLSTWFRDYLYIPLGGNRHGLARTCINKIIVFALCGLWHGANWTFLLWGLGHGLLLMFEEFVPIKKLPKVIGWVYAFVMVTLLFVLFRSDSVAQASTMISTMFTGFNFSYEAMNIALLPLNNLNIFTFFVALLAALKVFKIIFDKLQNSIDSSKNTAVKNTFLIIECVLALFLIVACLITLSSGGYNPFIYFRF